MSGSSNNRIIFSHDATPSPGGEGGRGVRPAFLLAKPTQFDAPFFRWMHTHRTDIPFVVFYWQPVGVSAHTDTETGASLTWGFDLLAGYPWHQVDAGDPEGFKKLLQQHDVRYLVCNGWKAGFAPLMEMARTMGIGLGLRIDSVLWGRPAVEMLIRKIVLRKAYRHFSHFFSSGTVCDAYLQAIGIPPTQWKRWPYCIDADYFTRTTERVEAANALKQRNGLDDRPLVLGVCKWVDRENPMELLQAFIRMNDPGLQLVMIGDGPLRGKMESLRNLHPDLRILFPGYVPFVELPAWFAATRVFVHSARYEPWGVSVHEALAAGCALVASTRVGSGYDLIRSGENGYQYPAGDVPALSASIRNALHLDDTNLQAANAALLSEWRYDAVVKAFKETSE